MLTAINLRAPDTKTTIRIVSVRTHAVVRVHRAQHTFISRFLYLFSPSRFCLNLLFCFVWRSLFRSVEDSLPFNALRLLINNAISRHHLLLWCFFPTLLPSMCSIFRHSLPSTLAFERMKNAAPLWRPRMTLAQYTQFTAQLNAFRAWCRGAGIACWCTSSSSLQLHKYIFHLFLCWIYIFSSMPLAACDAIFFITIFHTMLKSIEREFPFLLCWHMLMFASANTHPTGSHATVSAASQLQTNQWCVRRDAVILNWSKTKLRLHYPTVYAWWWQVNDAIAFDWNPHRRALTVCTPTS